MMDEIDYYCSICGKQVEAKTKCCHTAEPLFEVDINLPDLTNFVKYFDNQYVNKLKAKYTNWFSFPDQLKTVKLDGYDEETLTKDEAEFVDEVLKLYSTIPNMSSLLCLFYNNDLVEAGIETFTSLVKFVFLIEEPRMTELCIFIARLERSL